MGDLVLKGATSGQITVTPTGVAGTNTLTLPATTGNIITSADSGTVTQAMLASNVAGNGPAFSATCTTTQSIPNNIFTKVQLANKEFDTNSNFDNVTNYRFTPTIAGYYQVNWLIIISALTAEFIPALYKNGSLYQWGLNVATSSGHYNAGGAGALVYMNGSTDYLEAWVFQASGGALSLQLTSRLSGALVRAG